MEEKKIVQQPLQWHPAFYAGLQVEFAEEIHKLIFEEEHQLSKKPLEIDVLIIKKESKEKIRKNIGRIFRKYNIIEYKSPDDYLSIDAFYKVYGYACFYKADAVKEDEIKSHEITISYVCQNTPRKLIRHLREERNTEIVEVDVGIYYIKGLYFPIQLILTSEVSENVNFWLRNLTNRIEGKKNAQLLLKEYGKHKNANLYKAMMNVIVRANQEAFNQEDERMCEALMELVEDKIVLREQQAELRGEARGASRGREEEKLDLIKKKLTKGKTLEIIADELEENIETIQELISKLKTQ